MSTVVRREQNTKLRVYTKGSFETVLEKCTEAIYHSGERKALTMKQKTDLEETVQAIQKNGRKTIALAYKDLASSDLEGIFDETELEQILHKDLVLICVMGIEDRIRPDATESVRKCRRAGICVRMVTGENREAAKAIAKECGIISEVELRGGLRNMILDGEQLEEQVGGLISRPDASGKRQLKVKHEHRFAELSTNLKVLAKASSAHKLMLVAGLTRQPNHIVAMTGHEALDRDGLRTSHIGFAMGVRGTDITKEAADVILVNDNFSSIVAGVKWGRNIYQAIRKLVQFQIAANIVAIITACIGTLVTGDSPLSSLHLLWINLIIDAMASFCLPTDPPSDDILNGKPYSSSKPLISPTMWRYIVCLSSYQILSLLFLMLFGSSLFGLGAKKNLEEGWSPANAQLNTVIFNTYVYMQFFNFLCCRKIRSQGTHGLRNRRVQHTGEPFGQPEVCAHPDIDTGVAVRNSELRGRDNAVHATDAVATDALRRVRGRHAPRLVPRQDHPPENIRVQKRKSGVENQRVGKSEGTGAGREREFAVPADSRRKSGAEDTRFAAGLAVESEGITNKSTSFVSFPLC